ncbi:MAG: glycoside hydrolase family 3, partial [Desulfovibrionaceae bacterium]|nr:glycoside hydrolase family 3 [Desulfovibrionaceae bacterium]
GHLMHKDIDPNLPASLSPKAINGLLREKLGYEGVVITDDLQMNAITAHHSPKEAILLAVRAGVDILLCNNNVSYDDYLAVKMHKTILDLVEEGKIDRKRLEESYRRIRNLKQGLNN